MDMNTTKNDVSNTNNQITNKVEYIDNNEMFNGATYQYKLVNGTVSGSQKQPVYPVDNDVNNPNLNIYFNNPIKNEDGADVPKDQIIALVGKKGVKLGYEMKKQQEFSIHGLAPKVYGTVQFRDNPYTFSDALRQKLKDPYNDLVSNIGDIEVALVEKVFTINDGFASIPSEDEDTAHEKVGRFLFREVYPKLERLTHFGYMNLDMKFENLGLSQRQGSEQSYDIVFLDIAPDTFIPLRQNDEKLKTAYLLYSMCMLILNPHGALSRFHNFNISDNQYLMINTYTNTVDFLPEHYSPSRTQFLIHLFQNFNINKKDLYELFSYLNEYTRYNYEISIATFIGHYCFAVNMHLQMSECRIQGMDINLRQSGDVIDAQFKECDDSTIRTFVDLIYDMIQILNVEFKKG